MPFHKYRTWVVKPAESAEWLAEKLMNHSWCCCQGWSLGGYLFLNDATGEDGAFEIAVVKVPPEPDGAWWQVESITFGWIKGVPFGESADQKAARYIREAVAGQYDPGREGSVAMKCEKPDIETPEQHGRCMLCA